MNLSGVHIETLENRKLNLAIKLIRNSYDRNQDGQLDSYERRSAQLILFGHSLGGSAVIKLSRQLKKMDVPVLLTIQVDSVGFRDHIAPSNVMRAANLFQQNGWILSGEEEIAAENPNATTIIGNIEFDYRNKDVDMSNVPWERRLFSVPHSKMDADPEVWARVEKMILAEIMKEQDQPFMTDQQLAENLSSTCKSGATC